MENPHFQYFVTLEPFNKIQQVSFFAFFKLFPTKSWKNRLLVVENTLWSPYSKDILRDALMILFFYPKLNLIITNLVIILLIFLLATRCLKGCIVVLYQSWWGLVRWTLHTLLCLWLLKRQNLAFVTITAFWTFGWLTALFVWTTYPSYPDTLQKDVTRQWEEKTWEGRCFSHSLVVLL